MPPLGQNELNQHHIKIFDLWCHRFTRVLSQSCHVFLDLEQWNHSWLVYDHDSCILAEKAKWMIPLKIFFQNERQNKCTQNMALEYELLVRDRVDDQSRTFTPAHLPIAGNNIWGQVKFQWGLVIFTLGLERASGWGLIIQKMNFMTPKALGWCLRNHFSQPLLLQCFAIITQSIFSQILTTDIPQLAHEGEIWGVCSEFKVCCCHHSAINSIVLTHWPLGDSK